MSTTLLYYPTFNIPEHQWLVDGLLHWDEVASIVPHRMERVLDNPNIKYLLDEGCYRRFEPEPAFNTVSREQTFEKELAGRLDSPEFSAALTSNTSGQMWDVAFEKINQATWQVLAERQLTKTRHFSASWLSIRRPAAIVYMGLLAERLARTDADNFVKPSTDQELYEDLVFRGTGLTASLNGMSLKMLNLLPKAAPNTELRTLLDFKAKRQQELTQFKHIIHQCQIQIASCPNKQTAKLALDDFRQELEAYSNTIHRLLGEKRIQSVVGTLRMIFNIGGPTWLTNLQATAMGLAPAVISSCTGLGMLAGASIEVAAYKIESNQRRQAFKDTPCSYLYYAEKEGITAPSKRAS